MADNGWPVSGATPRRLLVATRNAGKRQELQDLLTSAGFEVVDLATVGITPSAEEAQLEQYATFEENALAKARFFHRQSGGLPTVADDSGLQVDALGGAPGVLSRRWSGEAGTEREVDAANNAKLLRELAPAATRTARFTCVIAHVSATSQLSVRGEVLGQITRQPRGHRGFGYDPLFAADELGGRTFAEVDPAVKATVSHRGRALRELVRALATSGVTDRR